MSNEDMGISKENQYADGRESSMEPHGNFEEEAHYEVEANDLYTEVMNAVREDVADIFPQNGNVKILNTPNWQLDLDDNHFVSWQMNALEAARFCDGDYSNEEFMNKFHPSIVYRSGHDDHGDINPDWDNRIPFKIVGQITPKSVSGREPGYWQKILIEQLEKIGDQHTVDLLKYKADYKEASS